MKKYLGIMALLLAIALPVFAQGRRLSSDDQRRFDSYFSRWQEYRRTNNRDEVISIPKITIAVKPTPAATLVSKRRIAGWLDFRFISVVLLIPFSNRLP